MASFSQIIGQRSAKDRIRPLLSGRPEQVYLITGPEGIGKRLFAHEMAKVLLCTHPTEDGACGACPSCHYLEESTHPDFIRLSPQPGEKNIKVAQVREKVVFDVSLYPQISGRKVYLIEADGLNEEGQNALLKTLEDTPSSVVILLTVSDTDKLLGTILSRAVNVKLSPNTDEEICQILSAKTDLDGKRILLISTISKGIPGTALRIAGDESLPEIREFVSDMLNAIPQIRVSDLLTERYAFFEDNKERINEVLTILQMGIGDIAQLVTDPRSSFLRVIDKRDNIIRMIENKQLTVTSVDRASVAVSEASKAVNSNYSFESAVCTMLLTIQKEFAHA